MQAQSRRPQRHWPRGLLLFLVWSVLTLNGLMLLRLMIGQCHRFSARVSTRQTQEPLLDGQTHGDSLESEREIKLETFSTQRDEPELEFDVKLGGSE